MSRINTNVSSLIAQHNLQRSNNDLQVSLQRLSTGLAIGRGADNPAGLIISERLRSEIVGVTQAIENAERAQNVISTTEAALQEVGNLLTSIKGLTIEAANTGAFSRTQIEANQRQVDSAVDSITRISNATSFAGLKLLNGSLDYVISGIDTDNIQDVTVFGANFGTNTTMPVTVEVLNSAENAKLFVFPGALLSSVTIEVQGNKGVEVLSFVSGTALSAVSFAVNSTSDATGVSAVLVNATDETSGLKMASQAFGSDAFVSVRKLAGGELFQTLSSQAGIVINRDMGEDVLALVNGNLALGNGLDLSMRSTAINISMTLSVTAATTLGISSFTVTGGGSIYQIGPSVNSSQQVGFGIQSVAASHLGAGGVGYLDSIKSGGANALTAGGAARAEQIIGVAIDQISVLRGRLGAFERNTLQTAIRSQQIALENLVSSESSIRDTDFARETAALTRAQILVSAGTSTLAIANSTAKNVLALLQ